MAENTTLWTKNSPFLLIEGDNEGKIVKSGEIADFIHQERIKQGLSISQLAKKSGVSDRAISYYERGLRSMQLDCAEKVLIALGYTLKIGDLEEKDVREDVEKG